MTGPVVGRRALAADLRRLRTESRRTIDDVAAYLECSAAKISRIETGTVKVGVQDLRALLDFYDVTGTVREAMLALVRQSRERGWWTEYGDVVPPGSARFFGLEDGATRIGQYSASLVPGLLQTRDYAAALIGSAPGIGAELATRRLELRMRRAGLLERATPPRMLVVLDEAVLWRRIGGSAVLAGQLRHLRAIAEREAVDLRIVEFAAPPHPAAGVSFTVFGFGSADARDDVVFCEQLDASSFLDEPERVAVYRDALAGAAQVAADADRSHDILRSRIEQL